MTRQDKTARFEQEGMTRLYADGSYGQVSPDIDIRVTWVPGYARTRTREREILDRDDERGQS